MATNLIVNGNFEAGLTSWNGDSISLSTGFSFMGDYSAYLENDLSRIRQIITVTEAGNHVFQFAAMASRQVPGTITSISVISEGAIIDSKPVIFDLYNGTGSQSIRPFVWTQVRGVSLNLTPGPWRVEINASYMYIDQISCIRAQTVRNPTFQGTANWFIMPGETTPVIADNRALINNDGFYLQSNTFIVNEGYYMIDVFLRATTGSTGPVGTVKITMLGQTWEWNITVTGTMTRYRRMFNFPFGFAATLRFESMTTGISAYVSGANIYPLVTYPSLIENNYMLETAAWRNNASNLITPTLLDSGSMDLTSILNYPANLLPIANTAKQTITGLVIGKTSFV